MFINMGKLIQINMGGELYKCVHLTLALALALPLPRTLALTLTLTLTLTQTLCRRCCHAV